jgi:hypothetical protein
MLLAGFEPTIPASERPQTHTFDRAATGISEDIYYTILPLDNVQSNRPKHVAHTCRIYYILISRVFLNIKFEYSYVTQWSDAPEVETCRQVKDITLVSCVDGNLFHSL